MMNIRIGVERTALFVTVRHAMELVRTSEKQMIWQST